MPAETVWACGDYARVLYLSFAREAMGAAGTRHSLRPLFSWANGFVRLGRITPPGANARRRHCEERLVRRSSTSEVEATKQSSFLRRGEMDCFAEPVIGRAF